MQTPRSCRSWHVRHWAAVALIGSLPALAAVTPARHSHAPSAGSGSWPQAATLASDAPTHRRPGAANAAARRAAEVERLAVHISKTWKTPLPQSRRIVRSAFVHAQKHHLSPTLVLAVVAQESGFRPTARSGYGAQGLMQVVPRHHPEKLKGLGPKALLTPETNIAVGTRVLAEYVERDNGQLHTALTKYSGKAAAYPRKVHLVWADLKQVRSHAEVSA